jgi:LysM repeat protein
MAFDGGIDNMDIDDLKNMAGNIGEKSVEDFNQTLTSNDEDNICKVEETESNQSDLESISEPNQEQFDKEVDLKTFPSAEVSQEIHTDYTTDIENEVSQDNNSINGVSMEENNLDSGDSQLNPEDIQETINSVEDNSTTYIVQKNDTVFGIAEALNVEIDQISGYGDDMNLIYPGDELTIDHNVNIIGATYKVHRGDTLSQVAKDSEIEVENIKGYKSDNPELIYPGEKLTSR